MPAVFVHTLSEFTTRHGDYVDRPSHADRKSPVGRSDLTPSVVHRLFANGASCSFDPSKAVRGGESDLITASEPPTERFALLQAQRGFLDAKYQKEWTVWVHNYKSTNEAVNFARLYSNMPMPSAGVIDDLKAGTARLALLKAAMASIDEELGEAPEAVAARQIKELEAEQLEKRRREVNDIQAELAAMENGVAARAAILAEQERLEAEQQAATRPLEFFQLLARSFRA